MAVYKFIDVALNVPLNQTFTYRVPESKENEETPNELFGLRVNVRFGSRKTTGVIVASYESFPSSCAVGEEKIKSAICFAERVPLLTKELFETAKFMSDYYISPIGECIFSMIPSGKSGKKETEIHSFPLSEDEESFDRKELSNEQKKATEGILDSTSRFHYLYGMTGSGKTEVFLSAAEKVIESGKEVIYLVPEISLTPQTIEAVKKRFGNSIAVLHSALTPGQRLTEWIRILKKEARIVVGARSAVFAPVPDLGLIIIDEEHDSSYKSGASPRYHARQIAMLRCRKACAPLVMGSATPSAEAWKGMQDGTLMRHTLTKRLAGGTLPAIKAVNLSLEKDRESCISHELKAEIDLALSEKKQTILFLNRRGFTHFFHCSTCGYELRCKNCSVSMTYHKSENRLRCHYCGYSLPPPNQCPRCGSLDTGYSGFGTEFIETEVKAKFPKASVVRIDTDSLTKKGELQEKLDDFRKGKIDIMLGTQMVAKGLNFPNLKLVGVILADTALHLPDFRAAERTFSLITQVSGRAGRYFPDGKVIVQSYSPDCEAIDFAVKGRIDDFYNHELKERELLSFPPYSRLLKLVFRSQIKEASEKAAEDAAIILRKKTHDGMEILGPSECPIEMVNGNHRFQIILRSKQIGPLQEASRHLVWGYKPPKNVYIEIDTDPVSML